MSASHVPATRATSAPKLTLRILVEEAFESGPADLLSRLATKHAVSVEHLSLTDAKWELRCVSFETGLLDREPIRIEVFALFGEVDELIRQNARRHADGLIFLVEATSLGARLAEELARRITTDIKQLPIPQRPEIVLAARRPSAGTTAPVATIAGHLGLATMATTTTMGLGTNASAQIVALAIHGCLNRRRERTTLRRSERPPLLVDQLIVALTASGAPSAALPPPAAGERLSTESLPTTPSKRAVATPPPDVSARPPIMRHGERQPSGHRPDPTHARVRTPLVVGQPPADPSELIAKIRRGQPLDGVDQA